MFLHVFASLRGYRIYTKLVSFKRQIGITCIPMVQPSIVVVKLRFLCLVEAFQEEHEKMCLHGVGATQ